MPQDKVYEILKEVLDNGWGLDEYGRPQDEHDEVITQARQALYSEVLKALPVEKEIDPDKIDSKHKAYVIAKHLVYNQALSDTKQAIKRLMLGGGALQPTCPITEGRRNQGL